MPTKKRTSTKAETRPKTKPRQTPIRSREGYAEFVSAYQQQVELWAREEHYLYLKLFSWYGPAMEKACPPESDALPWSDNAEPMRQVRLRAMREWKALTGLPALSPCELERWHAAAVAAGMQGIPVADVRSLQPDKLADVILPWALAKQLTMIAKHADTGDYLTLRKTRAAQCLKQRRTVRQMMKAIDNGEIRGKRVDGNVQQVKIHRDELDRAKLNRENQ